MLRLATAWLTRGGGNSCGLLALFDCMPPHSFSTLLLPTRETGPRESADRSAGFRPYFARIERRYVVAWAQGEQSARFASLKAAVDLAYAPLRRLDAGQRNARHSGRQQGERGRLPCDSQESAGAF